MKPFFNSILANILLGLALAMVIALTLVGLSALAIALASTESANYKNFELAMTFAGLLINVLIALATAAAAFVAYKGLGSWRLAKRHAQLEEIGWRKEAYIDSIEQYHRYKCYQFAPEKKDHQLYGYFENLENKRSEFVNSIHNIRYSEFELYLKFNSLNNEIFDSVFELYDLSPKYQDMIIDPSDTDWQDSLNTEEKRSVARLDQEAEHKIRNIRELSKDFQKVLLEELRQSK